MFSTPEITNEEKYIFHMEDITDGIALESNLGRKGLSLYNLHKFDVPVPEFFVISPKIFSNFVKKVLSDKGEELLKKGNPESSEILELFHRYDFDVDIKREILKEYTKLSGFSDAWVSVRSSVSYPQSNEVSFSGVFLTQLNIRGFSDAWVSVRSSVSYPQSNEVSFSGVFLTQLNIRGFAELLKSIKSIYSSVFTDSSVMYGVREGIDISDVTLAVVVQKMVHSEVSGTCFTLDPVTLNTSNMSLEAVYGLGDVIENGEITPDTYHLSKKNLEIYEKHIAPQEWMKVRSLTQSKSGFEKIKISPSWSHRQKLDDRYITEVSKISLVIEDRLNEHVDVEWAISGGRVYILQSKPAYTKNTYLSHHIQYSGYSFVPKDLKSVIQEYLGKKDASLEMIENSMMEAKKLIEKEANVTVIKQKEEVIEEAVEKTGQKELTNGIGVSFGRVSGIVKYISSGLETITKENILVFETYKKEFSDLVIRSSGVISKEGGLTSEISLISRELGIPAIVGVENLKDVITQGDRLEIDGNTGAIYLIDKAVVQQNEVAKEIVSKLEQEPVSQTVEPVRQVSSIDLSNLPKTASKIYIASDGFEVRPEYSFSDGVFFVDLDNLILNFGKHPGKVLDDGNYKQYSQEVIAPIVKLAKEIDPKEIMVVIGTGTVAKFAKLTGGTKYEPEDERVNTKGVARYLKSKKSLEVALRLIRRIRNINGCRNVSLGVYSPQNGVLMREIKKEISASGLRRGGSFKLYAVISSPSEVILADDILESEIDGVVLETPTLAKHMFNLPLESKNSVYDLGAGSILKILDTLILSTKSKEKRLLIVSEKNTDIVKYAVTKGVYGFIVPSESLKDIKTLVAQQENKLILGVK